ncbi:MAG: hypothetical protein ABII00_09205 [Elusimicrobiota bacterium]
METFNIGQLTKEMVAKRLSELEDPCAVAAELMEDALFSALRGAREFGPAQKAMVSEVCHGALTGILLRYHSVPRGAIQVLRGACSVAHRLSLDPTEIMTRAIRGMARIRAVATKEQLSETAYALEAQYMGAGELFSDECRKDATMPILRKAETPRT